MSNRWLIELLDLTDSEESSSSGLYDTNEHFVLELHDIKKDDPQRPQSETPTLDSRIKKRKKKRASPQVDKSATSTGSELSDAAPGEDGGKEEFYDANGSLHDMPGNPAMPTGTLALAQAHSEHGQEPKTTELTMPVSLRSSTTNREASVVTKPVTPDT